MDFLHLFPAGGSHSESLEPVIEAVGNVGEEAEIISPNDFAIVAPQGSFCHIDLILILAVGAQEEEHGCEEQAEEASHVGQNGVNFADGPLNVEGPGRPIYLKVDEHIPRNRNSIRCESFNVATRFHLFVAER